MKQRDWVLWNLSLGIVIIFSLMGCATSKVSVNPAEVEAEFSKSRVIIEELKSYQLPEKVITHYENLLHQAEAIKKQGKLELAMAQAKQVGEQASNFLQVWKDQQAKYEELQSLNPPDTLTYHYRNLMSQAKSAGEQGKVELAMELAKQAGEQAGMALQLWQEQIGKIREKLDRAKEELETLYPVNYPLIKRYWEAEARYQKKEYQDLLLEVEQLLKEIEKARNLSIITDRGLVVNAPQEYIKQWGNTRVYQEITPEGKLKTVIATVPNGMRVKFIRVKLFAPGVNFYYVEIPITGQQGWIAEKYLNVGETGY